MKKITYKVRGMHCASCELLIEEKLIQLPQVQAIDASTAKEELTVYYENEPPSTSEINLALKDDGYCLCEGCEVPKQSSTLLQSNDILKPIVIAAFVFGAFLLINRLGLTSVINVSSSSSLPAFFLFGLLAGVSTCAALVGGIVLSMAKDWGRSYKPHFLFNAGRIASYTLAGGILGFVGGKLQLSLTFSAFLVIAVSVFMILNGLKMLGIKALRGFQVALPKSLTHKATAGNFQGKGLPATMGALTILLPCGFTITVESLSLLSGNWTTGASIMAAFALGTAPGLLAIGLSSVKIGNSPKAAIFSKVAGSLVLMFAVFNINSQLNTLSLPSLSNLNIGASAKTGSDSGGTVAGVATEGLAPIVNGKQLLKMQASSTGYNPNYFKVKTGTPVRWEITDVGTSGCTNAIISNSLFSGQIALTPGQVSVKEFTPAKAGRYKFSCWMGMITGTIEVINQDGSANTAAPTEIPSGAKGCGCGGGSGSSCGGTR